MNGPESARALARASAQQSPTRAGSGLRGTPATPLYQSNHRSVGTLCHCSHTAASDGKSAELGRKTVNIPPAQAAVRLHDNYAPRKKDEEVDRVLPWQDALSPLTFFRGSEGQEAFHSDSCGYFNPGQRTRRWRLSGSNIMDSVRTTPRRRDRR